MSKATKSNTLKRRIVKQQRLWLEAYKNQWTVSGACLKVGINRTTFYKWIKKYPKFAKEAEEIDLDHVDYAVSKLAHLINESNLGAIIFYLKCRSEQWRPVEKRDVDAKFTSPELKQVADALKKLAEEKNDYETDAGDSDPAGDQEGEGIGSPTV